MRSWWRSRSYPLFEFLAELEDVRLRSYPLFYDYGWWIDFAELERSIGPRTRAIVAQLHPNNPTGHATGADERGKIEELCTRHGLALIVDEVFLDYPLGPESLKSFAQGPHPTLTFVLSGMSKIAALPQMKVGWIAVFGGEQDSGSALSRLEVIGDTFLSMNAPARDRSPRWLDGRRQIQRQILERAVANLDEIKKADLGLHQTHAGWSAVIRLPKVGIGAENLLEREGVVVHPGSFYGISGDETIVVSLIGPLKEFARGISKIAAVATAS